jgi:hypothetical protein
MSVDPLLPVVQELAYINVVEGRSVILLEVNLGEIVSVQL